MFTCCTNADCPRAGWCKRISYAQAYPDNEITWADFYIEGCKAENGYPDYVMNKAREIQERDIANGKIDKLDKEKDPYYNWKPGMREDDTADQRDSEPDGDRNTSNGNRILQLLSSSDRGSIDESMREIVEHFERTIREGLAIFQDDSCHVISSSGTEPGQPDNTVPISGLCQTGEDNDIGDEDNE